MNYALIISIEKYKFKWVMQIDDFKIFFELTYYKLFFNLFEIRHRILYSKSIQILINIF